MPSEENRIYRGFKVLESRPVGYKEEIVLAANLLGTYATFYCVHQSFYLEGRFFEDVEKARQDYLSRSYKE